jgi:Domain of unknown function (DUF5666)
MTAVNKTSITIAICLVSTSILLPPSYAGAWNYPQTAEATRQNPVTRRIGSIKAIDGNSLTLTPDSGPDVSVTVQGATRIVLVAPGERNLQNAASIRLQDLQVGDRILVGGRASDANSMMASSIVVMKRSDVEARQEKERQDWQKRGIGGLVTGADLGTGTVTISVSGLGGSKIVAVHASKDTIIRRYPADSVKFDDARPGTLGEIQPGDQLRARGNRSANGTELTAEEIVSGRFRNVAGTINSVDASTGTVSVQDLLSKKPVLLKITAESQLRQLPAPFAQRIAARLKGAAAGAGGANGATGSPPATATSGGTPKPGPGGMGEGSRAGGPIDFQQMLSRMPAVTLADLHKGDAVMIVSTEGKASAVGTAITLLSGVEPILEATPNAGQAMMLAPWSLGEAPVDAGNP